jgi:HAD superfamily hydrolase (TIGR01509 family)
MLDPTQTPSSASPATEDGPVIQSPFLPRPVRAVIFDMDGLLIDSERHVKAAVFDAAFAVGMPMHEDFYASVIGAPWPETFLRLKGFFGGEVVLAQFREAFEQCMAPRLPRIGLMPGVEALLDRLEAAGLPIAVATSTGRRKAEAHLRHVGIHHRFHAIVTRDDVDRGKPFPDPYLLAARHLGRAPDSCLALEDSHNGIRSAHAAGMMAVMAPDLLPATAEMTALCAGVVRDLNQVRLWLWSE